VAALLLLLQERLHDPLALLRHALHGLGKLLGIGHVDLGGLGVGHGVLRMC
jgi:hypothetical protein